LKIADWIRLNPSLSSRHRTERYGGPQLSRQNTIQQGKIKLVTAKYNSSRQNTIHHGKIQFEQQIQITHGKLQTLTAKTKTIIAIQNSSRQEQNAHGKSNTLTAIAKQSRQKQNAHGKIKSSIVVSGCLSTWCRASQSTGRRFAADFSRFIFSNVDT